LTEGEMENEGLNIMEQVKRSIEAQISEAVSAIRYQHGHKGELPDGMSVAARRLVEISRSKMPHVFDFDCLVDDKTDCCVLCGVHHGDPCPACRGRGFHTMPCTVVRPFTRDEQLEHQPHPGPSVPDWWEKKK
jgi:hypothetical protein